MAYLVYADITDEVVLAFGQTEVETYFAEVDDEINDIAEQLGVGSSNIDTDYNDTGRIHYKIRRYGIHYLSYRLLFDKAGVNNVEISPIDVEKYYVKAAEHKKQADMIKGELTDAMFTDDVSNQSDRAAYSAVMVRM